MGITHFVMDGLRFLLLEQSYLLRYAVWRRSWLVGLKS